MPLGDVKTRIVMKSLEKDRSRRYETANGLAADVQRYLADEQVQACPPSGAYRLKKFVRRNKTTLVTAAVIGMALLFGVGSMGWMMRDRSARHARLALRATTRAPSTLARITLNSSWTPATSAFAPTPSPTAGGVVGLLAPAARTLSFPVSPVVGL